MLPCAAPRAVVTPILSHLSAGRLHLAACCASPNSSRLGPECSAPSGYTPSCPTGSLSFPGLKYTQISAAPKVTSLALPSLEGSRPKCPAVQPTYPLGGLLSHALPPGFPVCVEWHLSPPPGTWEFFLLCPSLSTPAKTTNSYYFYLGSIFPGSLIHFPSPLNSNYPSGLLKRLILHLPASFSPLPRHCPYRAVCGDWHRSMV